MKLASALMKRFRLSNFPGVTNSEAYTPGSWQWLVLKEQHYGGYITNVRRNRVSALDPRTQAEILRGGMTGGDRMFVHGYAPIYAEFLERHTEKNELVIVEVGILKGTGLAIWSDLFPAATVIGMDIDPSHFRNNLSSLVSRGAFSNGKSIPKVFLFDQFKPDVTQLETYLGRRKIDVVIDDGFHSNETIQNTLDSMCPLLSDRFTYFIEDNADVTNSLKVASGVKVKAFGEMTVLTQN